MSFKFNFDSLRVLEVIDDNLPALLSTHSDSMPIRAERNGRKWRSHFDFLDLLSLDDVKEKEPTV